MRLIKVLGLAVFAVSAAMAIASASPAFATDEEVVVCGENLSLCAESKLLPNGAPISATATNSEATPLKLLGAINQTCKESKATGEIASAGGMAPTLKVNAISLTFTGCEPCTSVTATVEPGTITMTGETTWSLKAKGETTFKGCPFGVECKFGGEATLAGTNIAGGLQFVATKVSLKLTGGNSKTFCGEEGQWDATYKSTGHWLSSFELEDSNILDEEVVVCERERTLCAESEVLPNGATISATATDSGATPLTLLGAINQLCKESKATGEIASAGGMAPTLKVNTISLTFTGCEPCTSVTATVEPGTIAMTGETTWSLKAKGETTFKGCPFSVECKFGGEATLTGSNAAAGLQFVANKDELKLTGGNSKAFCGENGLWDATYKSTGHWLSSFKLP